MHEKSIKKKQVGASCQTCSGFNLLQMKKVVDAKAVVTVLSLDASNVTSIKLCADGMDEIVFIYSLRNHEM